MRTNTQCTNNINLITFEFRSVRQPTKFQGLMIKVNMDLTNFIKNPRYFNYSYLSFVSPYKAENKACLITTLTEVL